MERTDDLYHQLFDVVHRHPDDTDEDHSATVWSLIAARQWSERIGLQFVWTPHDRRDEEGETRYYCTCYFRGKPAGINRGWYDTSADDVCRAWAEGELAVALMHSAVGEEFERVTASFPEIRFEEIGNPLDFSLDFDE